MGLTNSKFLSFTAIKCRNGTDNIVLSGRAHDDSSLYFPSRYRPLLAKADLVVARLRPIEVGGNDHYQL